MTDVKLKGLTAEQSAALLPENLIFLGWRGSVAHGMYVPSDDPDSIDDKDLMGVFVGPVEHYLGFGGSDVREKWEGVYDCVFYEVRKMVSLLLNCNPNVLSLLWLKDNAIIFNTPLGQRLQENRDIFVTKKAYHSFNGYAKTNTNSWTSSVGYGRSTRFKQKRNDYSRWHLRRTFAPRYRLSRIASAPNGS